MYVHLASYIYLQAVYVQPSCMCVCLSVHHFDLHVHLLSIEWVTHAACMHTARYIYRLPVWFFCRFDIHQICCGKLGIQQGSHTLWSLVPALWASIGSWSKLGKRQKKKLKNGKRQICLCACVYVTLAPVTLVIHRERALDNNSGNININQTLMHRFNATLDELELKEHHSRQ